MLRNKNLIPLSHQHQRALALCVRIERATGAASHMKEWQAEIAQVFRDEIGIHFAAEQSVLFPAARSFEELVPLVEDLIGDHAVLREQFAAAEAGTMTVGDLGTFAKLLSTHIRREERELFEAMQRLMREEELAALGKKLDVALKDANQACALPSAATRLRAKNR